MISALASMLLAFALNGVPKDCPLFERRYTVPPINGPREISKDPAPKVKP